MLENAKEIFFIKITNTIDKDDKSSIGGAFKYNAQTNQFDVLVKEKMFRDDDFELLEKLSHELKHADQYLNKKIAFYVHSDNSVVAEYYDIFDEIEAYERQGMFGSTSSPNDVFNDTYYKELPWSRLSVPQIVDVNTINRNNYYYEKYGHPLLLYNGWKKNIIR